MPNQNNGTTSFGIVGHTCTQEGGAITVSQIKTDGNSVLTIRIFAPNGNQIGNIDYPSNTQNANFVSDPVNNGNHLVEISSATNNVSGEVAEYPVNVQCGPSTPPVDDLTLTVSVTNPTETGLADGKAVFNVSTSNNPFSTELNFYGYVQGKTEYTGLAAGNYTANVIDAAGFTKSVPFTLIDPIPEPLAPALYYAVGGVLPNPINFTFNFATNNLGTPKARHQVEVELSVEGTIIDTFKQRVRDGLAVVDVSSYLKRTLSLDNTLSLMHAENEVKTFSIRYREWFDNTPQAWKIDKQPRYAVQAALQDYSSDFNAYVVRGSYDPDMPPVDEFYKWHTSFDVPIKWSCHGTFLTTIIDKSLIGTPLYFERTYYASNGDIVERKSTLIEEANYGKLLRLQITDDVLPCANYIDAVITDVLREIPGSCPEGTPPPIGYKIFSKEFDNSFE